MAELKPLDNQALLEIIEEKEEKTQGGILLPENAGSENQPSMGKIVGLGDGKKLAKRGLKVGEKVIYSKYAGTEVTYKDTKYVLVGATDILAVVKGK